MRTKVCAFTGHRPNRYPWKYNENSPECTALKSCLQTEIEALILQGYSIFLSGMALGVDTWCAEIILALKDIYRNVKLGCILGCVTQANRWPEREQKRFYTILEQADIIDYLNLAYQKRCMLDRDCILAEKSDLLLAVFDGFQKGGTAYTVRTAKKLHKPVITIHPVTRQVSKSRQF